eukprot:TRINITY_DN2523_c0_g2_i1.p1 TRINITY_DN2523_c0_g2~~TRINITY_DN2523_c0_g2_i1.p1  ORF type:complete len:327 (-),score=55.85 TRINITY_DN2523_c0_g2_i1:361-1341(-)
MMHPRSLSFALRASSARAAFSELRSIPLSARYCTSTTRRTEEATTAPVSEKRGGQQKHSGEARKVSQRVVHEPKEPGPADLEQCEKDVQSLDRELWLVGQNFGKHKWAYYVLTSLHLHLHGLPFRAPAEQAQLARLQWWKSTINDLFEFKVVPTPQHRALFLLLREYPKLMKLHFRRMLDTRIKHVSAAGQPEDADALFQYAEGTTSAWLYLCLQLLLTDPASIPPGSPAATDPQLQQELQKQQHAAEHAASHLGKALGVLHLLRDTAKFAQHDVLFLPFEVCQAYGLSGDTVRQFQNTEELRNTVCSIATIVDREVFSTVLRYFS